MQNQNQAIVENPGIKVKNGFNNSSDLNPVSEKTRKGGCLPALKVLMYHRIVEDRDLSDHCELCVHIHEFRNHLEILGHLGYTPVTFKDLHLFRQGEILLPKKPIIITFDDGYLDTYSRAYPLLKEYGMRAVIFVLGNRSLQTNIWDQEDPGIPMAPLMKDHHVKELHEKGFEIGAHSLSHNDLQKLSAEEVRVEINSSKLILESMIDSPVYSFSYPFGSVNALTKRVVSECGFEFGCSVYTGPAKFGTDLHEIRRLTINNTTNAAGLVMRLKAPFEYAEWMWWKSKDVLNRGSWYGNGNGKV